MEVLRRAKPRAFRSRKCSESQPPQVENHGAATKTLPGSPDRGGAEPGPSGSAPRLPSWGCAGTAGCPAASARVVVLKSHERAHQSELGFEQQNRFRNLREIQRIEKKAFRAHADAAQSARQGGTEPGPPASETDAGPPGHQPRGGAPARPRLSRGQGGPT